MKKPIFVLCSPASKQIFLCLWLLTIAYASTQLVRSDPSVAPVSVGKNRLFRQTSPYLLLHAHDPVNWYPWGAEAFAMARKENKPILLSIGFAACHWCHVMQHESFQDQEIASLMNNYFINVAVDRQERPDLDTIYAQATEAITGRAGWPMTVFLTPELKPFYAGTYYPAKAERGLPAFKTVLNVVHDQWLKHHDKVAQDADEIVALLAKTENLHSLQKSLSPSILRDAAERLLQASDSKWGGIFGSDPRKFPVPVPLSLAICLSQPSADLDPAIRCRLLSFVTTTLNKMSQGAVQDHVGGGFFRYGTNREWDRPHFEKMLPDNALIAVSFINGYRITGNKIWAQTAKNILEFALRELRTKDGAFIASLDADSAGKEGGYYLFSYTDFVLALGKADGQWLAAIYNVSKVGNFASDENALRLVDSPASLALNKHQSEEEFQQRLNRLNRKLKTYQEKRVRPPRDENVITGWNALMISAMIEGYKIFGEDKYLQAAKRSMQLILSRSDHYEQLPRILLAEPNNCPGTPGFLDDYAYTVQALLDLASVDPDPIWLNRAEELTDDMLRLFWDNKGTGFFYTGTKDGNKEHLFTRLRTSTDSVLPSGLSIAIIDLIKLWQFSSRKTYIEKAEATLKLYAVSRQINQPMKNASMLNALQEYLHAGCQIVLCADSASSTYKPLFQAIGKAYLPNSVVLFYDPRKIPANSLKKFPAAELLQGKQVIDGKPTVYVCKDNVCLRPIMDVQNLLLKLRACKK